MRLTIIPSDNAVYVNGQSYLDLNLASCQIPVDVHALQWYDSYGEIEFISDKIPNQTIDVLPDWANSCVEVWNETDYIHKHPPAPTPDQLIDQCKTQAKQFLQETDWSEIPSVSDVLSVPHLLNTAEFIEYRIMIRNYVVNPIVDPTWPTKPIAQWSQST